MGDRICQLLHHCPGRFPGTMPIAITRETLQKDLVFTHKYDGERVLILLEGDQCTVVDRRLKTLFTHTESEVRSRPWILDAERVGEELYVFDTLMRNGICVRELDHAARVAAIPKTFLKKTFSRDRPADTGVPSDGFIAVERGSNYFAYQYKWKPVPTVDLYVRGRTLLANSVEGFTVVRVLPEPLPWDETVVEFTVPDLSPLRSRPDKTHPNFITVVADTYLTAAARISIHELFPHRVSIVADLVRGELHLKEGFFMLAPARGPRGRYLYEVGSGYCVQVGKSEGELSSFKDLLSSSVTTNEPHDQSNDTGDGETRGHADKKRREG
jgi:hypothetical protein